MTTNNEPAVPCPGLAISIRQPWAWLILHAGKDIENRDWATKVRGRVLIHASKGMTGVEYVDALNFARVARADMEPPPPPVTCPGVNGIERGGIVGSVEIVDCVDGSESPWFMGRYGFALRNPIILPFLPYKGALGFFRVQAALFRMAEKRLEALAAPKGEIPLDEMTRLDQERGEWGDKP